MCLVYIGGCVTVCGLCIHVRQRVDERGTFTLHASRRRAATPHTQRGQVMQNKSEKYSRAYRRCPKVSVAELREAMGAPLNAHSATASLARAAPTGGRCARPASSRCTTRPQTRVRTPLVASGSRWLDDQHPLGRLLGPAAAVAAVGLRDSRLPPTSGGRAAMDAESAKMHTRFCDPAAWFDKRHRSRVGELTILFSSLGLVTAISTLRARSEATRPGSGL